MEKAGANWWEVRIYNDYKALSGIVSRYSETGKTMLNRIYQMFVSKPHQLNEECSEIYTVLCLTSIMKANASVSDKFAFEDINAQVSDKSPNLTFFEGCWPLLLHNVMVFGEPKPDQRFVSLLVEANSAITHLDNPWKDLAKKCVSEGVAIEQLLSQASMTEKNILSISRKHWESGINNITKDLKSWLKEHYLVKG